jgi:hypothetical protein
MELCSDDYMIISFFHECSYFWCLCRDNIVILVAHFFLHLLVTIHLLSVMPLLHTIYWLFYYWAHPIANDAFIARLASKVISYLVNCNIGVIFCLKFLPPQNALAPAVEVVSTSAKMFFVRWLSQSDGHGPSSRKLLEPASDSTVHICFAPRRFLLSWV